MLSLCCFCCPKPSPHRCRRTTRPTHCPEWRENIQSAFGVLHQRKSMFVLVKDSSESLLLRSSNQHCFYQVDEQSLHHCFSIPLCNLRPSRRMLKKPFDFEIGQQILSQCQQYSMQIYLRVWGVFLCCRTRHPSKVPNKPLRFCRMSSIPSQHNHTSRLCNAVSTSLE